MTRTARTVLSLLLACPGLAAAGPPTLTSLFPAGARRGTTVEVTAAGTFDTWPVQAWASDPKLVIQANKEKGKLSVTPAPDLPPGVYWVRLHNHTGASQLRPFIVGTLPELLEREPNDTVTAAQHVAGPVVVNGTLGKNGDVDCFAVALSRGQTLVASLEAFETLRSPVDAVLQVVTADGTVLEQNHDYHGLDPQIAFTAPKDGSYVVRMFAFPAQPDSSIHHFGSPAAVYRLTLTTQEFVDFVTPLAAEVGQDTTFTLHGWNLTRTSAGLRDLLGGFGYPSQRGVRSETHPCHDLTNSLPATPLAPPFTATGQLPHPEASSSITFTGAKSKPLVIRLESATLGFPLTPVVRILDHQGKQLTKLEPTTLNADIDTLFTPPADGIYRFEVRDLHHRGGERFVYCLHVLPALPDFEANLASDRIVVTAGKPTDVAITLVRKHGFVDALDCQVQGLPAGVRASVLGGLPEAKTMTVRLEATHPGNGGPVHLVLTTKRDPLVRRTVTATLSDFGTTTSEMWLSVVAAPAK